MQAIKVDPEDATLYSNRSLCHLKSGEAHDALADAIACVNLQPDWAKGYYRKGAALMSLKVRILASFPDLHLCVCASPPPPI